MHKKEKKKPKLIITFSDEKTTPEKEKQALAQYVFLVLGWYQKGGANG